jgi:DNA primase small subunit
LSTDVKSTSRADATLSFLRRTYREYYYEHHDALETPTKISSREFGYVPFGGGMIRHLSYKSRGELAADLVKQAPSSVYCSNATYSNPTLAMDEKGWNGAELIFDIDAGMIPTACRSRHAISLCKTCGRTARGARPATCPKCGGTDLHQLQWSCDECLEATKQHAVRLTDFLTEDFGVPGSKINTYFSGNRGYHLHVLDERFGPMVPAARAEIASYVRGKGLIVRNRGDGEGWSPRIAEVVSRGMTQHLLDNVVASYGAMIDEAVTTDIHRIFRMPGTLHGSSGLLKARVRDLPSFRPDVDPVVLGDEPVKVFVEYSPEFRLRGRKFGPYSGAKVDLPCYAAVFLLAKGLGGVSD